MAKVTNPAVRAFIEKCIAEVSERLTAKELLMDPFLQLDQDHGSRGRSLLPKTHHLGKFLYIQQRPKAFMVLFSHFDLSNTEGNSDQIDVVKSAKEPSETSRDFTVQGQRKDVNTIFLKLRIADSSG